MATSLALMPAGRFLTSIFIVFFVGAGLNDWIDLLGLILVFLIPEFFNGLLLERLFICFVMNSKDRLPLNDESKIYIFIFNFIKYGRC